MTLRPPKGQPKTEKHLGQLVARYAEDAGLALRRVRLQISAMAFVGALERVREEDSHQRFLIKGGMACELRFQEKARTTRDLDAVFHGSLDELLSDLDAAFAEPYSGFTFAYGDPRPVGATSAQRFEVKLQYQGRAWGTLRVEVSPPEGRSGDEADRVPAISVAVFGLEGPEFVACLSLRYQIAQKLHACTERFDDRENERAHDLIDLLLMEELIEDYLGVRQACLETFEIRDTHAWPPALNAEPNWREVYAALAEEFAFPITDVDEAVAGVQAMIARINEAH
jgi:hypothetical protein